MKIEFLQSYEDASEFVDFLYNNSLCISWKGTTIERWKAKELLRANLISNTGGNYCIGNTNCINLLEFNPCGRTSHPRYVHRNGRYAGRICEYRSQHNKQLSNEVIRIIKKFLSKTYVFQRVNPCARFCAYFGPHYVLLENNFIAKEMPSHICFGYALLKSSAENVLQASQKIQDVVNSQELIQPLDFWQCYAHDSFVEHYLTFTIDRSSAKIEHIKGIAEKLQCKGHILRVINANLYDEIISTPPFQFCSSNEWEITITVEREWKGFGNFN